MTPVITCPVCKGTRVMRLTSRKNAGKETSCENCNGTGIVASSQGPTPDPNDKN